MDSKKLYPLAALGYEFFIRVSNFSKNQKLSSKISLKNGGALRNGVKLYFSKIQTL